MGRRFITDVKPLKDYILRVRFISGSFVLLDMKQQLDRIRFLPLRDQKVWQSATTNGMFVRFGNVEISHDEILTMLECPPDPA